MNNENTTAPAAVTYYAVYTGPSGPISVELNGDTPDEAEADAESRQYGGAEGEDDGLGRDWYDAGLTDLEEALDLDLAGKEGGGVFAALSAAGATYLRELGDGWELWSV